MIVVIKYAEIGRSRGEDMPDPLIYDGQMCQRQRWDDDAGEAVYTNALPEPEPEPEPEPKKPRKSRSTK